MTQPSLLPTPTYTDRVETIFRTHPNQWISADVLMKLGGLYGWRTRCSECRKRGMVIENRMRKRDNGSTISEYRYVPTTEVPSHA